VNTIEQKNVIWSKNHFRIMANGGTWGVPRSGLLWQKHGDELVLLARMPWVREMPITAEQLQQQQDADIESISEHMRAAGVKVRT
jgi:hypothetical protein